MLNIPEVKLGLVAVSRDCFPIALSRTRRDAVYAECQKLGLDVYKVDTIIEGENNIPAALGELRDNGCNALVVYLGNFGPEGPETMLAQLCNLPSMFVGAAEEDTACLSDARGDAYCGMLNASYNIKLRRMMAYIPEYPIGLPNEIAKMIQSFVPIARVVIGVCNLKILSYGPRPHDFLACNAPIAPLYNIGVEIMENSELDLYNAYLAHEGDKRIPEVIADMEKELCGKNQHPTVLTKLAQYELTLMDEYEKNRGMAKYAVFANKCWPAFQHSFNFVPCYVNSRLASRGIPVSCETDIYGALSEYIISCASMLPATLLDINNTVPNDLHQANYSAFKGYKPTDLFMGFHCGNTPSACMANFELKHQLIMKRLVEPDTAPDKTRGTLEGTLRAGDITVFRLQSDATGILRSYIAQGAVIDADPKSFGGIGIIGVKEMARFYRHVLIEKGYPHHAGIGFANIGHTLYEVMKMLGVGDIAYNLPANTLYPTENPFVNR